MIYKVYAIRDVKVGFMPMICQQNDGTAIRAFETAIINSRDDLGTHPQDFDLYRIGSYDTNNGELTPEDPPTMIYSGASVRREV